MGVICNLVCVLLCEYNLYVLIECFVFHSNAEVIRALEFSQWLEVLGQLFQAMLKLLRAIQVIKII